MAVETQIMEFGQTPKQLFDCPHPQRCFPTQIVTAENGVNSNVVDVVDSVLSNVAGACQSVQCFLTTWINEVYVCNLESHFSHLLLDSFMLPSNFMGNPHASMSTCC